jgi:hypothetical protein
MCDAKRISTRHTGQLTNYRNGVSGKSPIALGALNISTHWVDPERNTVVKEVVVLVIFNLFPREKATVVTFSAVIASFVSTVISRLIVLSGVRPHANPIQTLFVTSVHVELARKPITISPPFSEDDVLNDDHHCDPLSQEFLRRPRGFFCMSKTDLQRRHDYQYKTVGKYCKSSSRNYHTTDGTTEL